MNILIPIAIYAAITLYVLLALRRAPIDERRDEREIGRYGARL